MDCNIEFNDEICTVLPVPCEDDLENICVLQELLAASKLREAEASLALKDLRSKLGELNTMWHKHLKRADTSPKVGTMD